MSRPWVLVAALLEVAAILLLSPCALAQRLDPARAPEPLRPWTDWVLHGKEDALCPSLSRPGAPELLRCAWPTRLSLSLDPKGGRFEQRWHLDRRAWVPLPGDEARWPMDVQIGAKKAVVVARGSVPSVELPAGDHTITGAFRWDALPDALALPKETGVLTLTVDGTPVVEPRRGDSGQLFFGHNLVEAEGERLDVVVHRKVKDDVPLMLTTRVVLDVSGKSREIVLGKSLPPGFVPLSITSELPARIEPDTRLRVQVRPGTWTIELAARSEGLVAALARPKPDGAWRDGEEVWVFEARTALRLVSVEGVRAVDPQQTSLPDEWKKLPAYAMGLGDEMQLSEKRRGDVEPEPDRLTLSRSLWLDFDGDGYTASDTITGTLHRASRLEVLPRAEAPSHLVLGRVAIDGKDQFITTLDESEGKAAASPREVGVEVRQGQLNVSADARISGSRQNIPAVGYDHDFDRVSATLYVPPGFRLFHASGADEVPGTWVRGWTLFELFLVLILALSFAKLFGWPWGVIALVTFALVFPETDAAKWLWPLALAAEALARVVPAGKARSAFSVIRGALLLFLVLATLPFVVQHVREGMYPALVMDEPRSFGAVGDAMFESKSEMAAPAMVQAPGAPAPEPEQAQNMAIAEEAQDVSQGPSDSKRAYGGAAKLAKQKAVSYRQYNAEVYDPNAMVQTGPGLPTWRWAATSISFSGPVERSQRLRLYFLSPPVNLALALLRAVLLALLFLRLIPYKNTRLPGIQPAAIGFAALAFLLVDARSARADVPSTEMLDQLRDRLLARPDCAPMCAASSRMLVEARAGTLRARLSIEASATTAVPLPGGAAQWLPERVFLNGKDATALVRTDDGVLWLRVPEGTHDVVVEGPLPIRESVQIALPLKPHRVEATVSGYLLEGLHEDGLADDHLQLTRVRTEGGATGGALAAGALPPFVTVQRTLLVGLNWQVETRVARVTPSGTAVVLEVPLLAGESVTTPNVRVVQGKALVNMPPDAEEVSWRSSLQERSPIVLTAPGPGATATVAWTEVWRLDTSPIWHATLSGIPVVHGQAGARVPEWRPWPGETATIGLTRPAGIPGRTLTIDRSEYEVRPGLRTTDATVTLSLRSSRGGEHVVTLPDGAALESLTVNGASQPLRQQGRRVTLSVTPGQQNVVFAFRLPTGITTRFTVPALDVGTETVNATTSVHLSNARWVLFAQGPRLGPAVLFWSLLLVLLAVAYGLGSVRMVPMARYEWVLLAIGLSQVPLPAAVLVVGWLFALAYRRERPFASRWLFDLGQLALVGWTLLALGVLVFAVQQGLMGTPEMQISGFGSSAGQLRWFDDRTSASLERPFVLSVPMLAYRAAMLAWALWLALSLLRWLRFGWASFSAGGLWKKRTLRVPPPIDPVPAVVTPGPTEPPSRL